MSLIERVYAAAARAKLLVTCSWQPSDASAVQTQAVGWSHPDETLMSGLASGHQYAMTYPAGRLVGLAAGDVVRVDALDYQVRELRAIGDGAEMRATLTRV